MCKDKIKGSFDNTRNRGCRDEEILNAQFLGEKSYG